MRQVPAIGLLCALGAAANAQLVINEAFENPPGGNDEFWEYVEFYGPAGMPLDGYAVALLKGGTDRDGDDIPENPAEIDEAFTLDGLTLGANGLLLLVNDTGGGSFAEGLADPDTTIAYFSAQHIPTSDTPGKLANDWSSTYVLVRRRPAEDSQYGTAWRKETDPDANFDGRADFGPPHQPFGTSVEPYQMVDDIAWSHEGGKEYVRDGDDEISDTPDFNPDAISRVAYRGENPGFGTSRADEEWVYGDLVDLVDLEFDPARSGGPTGIDRAGFSVTPGAFNDSDLHSQFRFAPGDLDFDGRATGLDLCLAAGLLGATPDDTETRTNDNGTPDDDSDDFEFEAWKHEGRALNGLQALRALDTDDDGLGGNSEQATAEDLAALLAVACVADWNGDGVVNTIDFLAYLNQWVDGSGCADLNGSGSVNTQDFLVFLNRWSSGC